MQSLVQAPSCRLRVAALAALVTLLLLALACGDDDNGGPTGTAATVTPSPAATASPTSGASPVPSPSPGVTIRTLTADWASDNARDLATLAASSTHIFFGQVTALAGLRMESIGRGDAVEVPVSTFDADVQTAFKGEFPPGEDTLIEQVGGLIEENGTDVIIILEGDVLLEVGQTYLFFSIEKANGTLNTPPFGRFSLSEDGHLDSLPEWTGLPVSILMSGLSQPEAAQAIESEVD